MPLQHINFTLVYYLKWPQLWYLWNQQVKTFLDYYCGFRLSNSLITIFLGPLYVIKFCLYIVLLSYWLLMFKPGPKKLNLELEPDNMIRWLVWDWLEQRAFVLSSSTLDLIHVVFSFTLLLIDWCLLNLIFEPRNWTN